MSSVQEKFITAAAVTKEFTTKFITDIRDDVISTFEDVKTELTPNKDLYSENIEYIKKSLFSFVHIPYLPSLHSPGWLLRYIVGPYNGAWLESFINDFGAGLTVGLLLIPQGLSYAQLANMPPVNGLYTAILPGSVYTFFGSSLQLAVGPVALASLLVGGLVTTFAGASPTNQQAIDVGTQASLGVGIVLIVMSVLNLGSLIHYVAQPVMSGFTTGAAMVIGLNQLKNAFGFLTKAPQQGQPNYDWNYQVMNWFLEQWSLPYAFTYTDSVTGKKVSTTTDPKNPLAIQITFGVFIPLLFTKLLLDRVKRTLPKESQATLAFKIFQFIVYISPFIALVIATNQTYLIKKDYPYTTANKPLLPNTPNNIYPNNLSIVGYVTPGLNFISAPNLPYAWGNFFAALIPLTFIAFMEGYGVAYRIASQRNELHILNASQEMFAIGAANLLGSIASGFPVSGSFSRSALNAAAGARTPLSKVTTLMILVIALTQLTGTFFYIPQAALAAVIWVAIWDLIRFDHLWHALKYSPKDFFLILITLAGEFIFSTEVGLAVGLSLSLAIYAAEHAFSTPTQAHLTATAETNNGINVITFEGADFTFVNSEKIRSLIIGLSFVEVKAANEIEQNIHNKVFDTVTSTLDRTLRPGLPKPIHSLPKAIIVDLATVRVVDITSLIGLEDAIDQTVKRGVSIIFINIHPAVLPKLKKFGIKNAVVNNDNNQYSPYLKLSELEVSEESKDVVLVETVNLKGVGTV